MGDRVVLSLSVAAHIHPGIAGGYALKIVTQGYGFQWLPEPFRSARSAVEDSGDFKPWR